MGDHDRYVTIQPAVGYERYNVVIMAYDPKHDEWFVFRISDPMKRPVADSLAKSWAAAGGMEIR